MANRWGNIGNSNRVYILWPQNHCDGDCNHEIKKRLLLGKKVMINLDSILKKQTSFCQQSSAQSKLWFFQYPYSSHVWRWELDQKKAEHQRIDAFQLWCWRRLLRVPWTVRRSNQSVLKEINPKYSQEGLNIHAKAEAPIFWPPDAKSRLIRKYPDTEKDWRQEEKEALEDEMVGCHHRLNGHESEQTLGDGEGQGSLACFSPWSPKIGHDWAI